MDQYKTMVTLPAGWSDFLGSPDKVNNTVQAYQLVPLIYRAIQLRADSLASVPFGLYDENDKAVDWDFTVSPSKLIHDLEAGLLVTGAGYIEPARNQSGVLKNLVWINPTSMELQYAAGKFDFKQTNNEAGHWVNIPAMNQYQLVYFREFDLADDVHPGTSAVKVALTSAGLLRYTSSFASKFFEGGAMPVGILSILNNISDAERDRTENWFKRQITGIQKAWKVLALRSDAKFQFVTPPIKDMVMTELRDQARLDIANAFGIPPTMLADAANYATAAEHRKSFWQDTVRPRGQWIEQVLNQQLFDLTKFGSKKLHAHFAFDELDIFQEDESTRSASLLNLVAAGFDVLTAADVLGYDLTDEQIAAIDAQALTSNITTPTDVQKSKWMRKALKSLERGKSAAVPFDSDVIPADEHTRIVNMLTVAATPAEVRRAFERRDSQGSIDRLNDTLREAMNRLD